MFSICIWSVKTLLKIIWRRFLVLRSERLLVSSATLLCKTQNIVYILYTIPVSFIKQDFKYLAQHNFFILKFHCFMCLLNSISSIIYLGQRCKGHSFLPNFSTPSNLFTLQVKTLHKINRIFLISLQI